MSLVAAGIGGAVSVGIAGYSHYQAGKAKKEAERRMQSLKKPKYEIPEEMKKSLSEAEGRTVEGLSAQAKSDWAKGMDRQAALALKAGEDRKAGLAGLQQQTQMATDAYSQMVSADAAKREQQEQQKRADIAAARSAIIGAKDKQFNLDQADYQAQLQAAQGDYQAAAQTQEGAKMSMAQSVLGFAGTAAGAGMAGGIGSGASKGSGMGAGNMAGGIGSSSTGGFGQPKASFGQNTGNTFGAGTMTASNYNF